MRIIQWCEGFKLNLNMDKCCTVTYTRTLTPLNTSYYIDDRLLEKKYGMKDFGVLFDPKLSFLPHLDNVFSS